MEKKSVLRNSQQYEGVYINHDKSLQERQMVDNFRTILNSLNVGDLVMKGSRVMKGNKRDRVSSPTDGLCDNNRSSRDGNVSNNDRLERNSQSDRQGVNPNIDRRGLNYSNDRRGGNSDNDGQKNNRYSDRRCGNNGRDIQENSNRVVHENNR
ncbi:hypothetical protein DPMN_073770 [Dreissena polymorpha]|uniref:Uncharacterized protein n=1 Tax=Dreissena polymorpha TaxID=45954 RepID=A0A9D4HDY6_DREPO|nr:hypothetical protein DPMN_073770 [Dreissena polymorpha]